MTKDKDKTIQKHGKIVSMLEDSGIEATEYERILGMEALTGGENNILYETDQAGAMILGIMKAITDPLKADGTIDDDLAYDCPVIRTFLTEYKYNMKSNKRKGLMELVKVMRGEQEDESFTSRIKDAITGSD